MPPEVLGRRREQVTHKLKRLSLGRSAAISSTVNPQGEVVTEAAEIVAAFRAYWAPTFAHELVNCTLLQKWLQEDVENPRGLKQAFAHVAQEPTNWHIRRHDIRRAVELSGESAPGPDGIPYAAWRAWGSTT